MKIIKLNIYSIKLQTSNLKDKIQMLWLINIYNLCSLSIIFIEESFTISRLNKLIKDDCEQLIVEDFNLHHSHWEDRRCFTHHTVTDALLDIIINVRLKLLLELNIITKETHNQLTTINLVFDSEKIQFMIYKCKMRINLHQESDHFSIVMKLCLHTFFMQLMTCQLWKKMNTEALNTHLKNTSFRWLFSWWQDSDRWQSNWDYSCITKSHQEVYFLSKVIKLSMRLLKSNLLESCDKIAMTMNHMKNAEYFRSMKRLSEIQRS